MYSVLGRMAAAGEALISDRHAASVLVSFLGEADRVEDAQAAQDEVRKEIVSAWGYDDGPEGPSKPFIYQDGVAVIPVHGILLNRFNWCWGFVTGYDFIRKQMNAAEADEDVKLIVFDHDTPGGEAAGCDELAREIKALKTSTMALVNTSSCSGGYWLAAPCTRIVCAPSGSVGSIGVYIQHMNMAKMLAEWGLEIEFVKNGALKTAGNPYEPLDDAAREYLQAMVDERADEFHAAVAEFRGIEVSVVKGTDARVMRPAEAISLGLIDAAENPTTAVASFVAELANDNDETTTEDEVEPLEETSMAMTEEERAAEQAATKARIKGIMTHEEAKGREGLAEHLAYDTDNTVEQAAAIMKFSPKAEDKKADEGDGSTTTTTETTTDDKSKGDEGKGDEGKGDQAKGTKFEQAMDQGQHPNVGPDGGDGGNGDQAASNIDRILGAQSMATGRTYDKKQGKAA
jgi:signal peptide peptidase SppA